MRFIRNYYVESKPERDIELIKFYTEFGEILVEKPIVVLDDKWFGKVKELNSQEVYKFVNEPTIFFKKEYEEIIKTTKLVFFEVELESDNVYKAILSEQNNPNALYLRFENEVADAFTEAMEQGKCYFDIMNQQLLIKEEE